MAVEFKDYYAVLEVSREATADEIKTAFRKLARKYHPDVAKDKKTAEEKFKEINEAHEVLSDPEKRKKYDELGPNWQQGAPSPGAGRQNWAGARGPSGETEFHFGGTGFSDFFEQLFGARGGGNPDLDNFFNRSRARGEAPEEPGYAMPGREIEGDVLVTLDESLNGSMRTISLRRIDPNTGETKTETFTVRIPPGAQDGRRIRVPGKGGAGIGGGPAGDLYLRVRLAAHPDFEARGADLYHELELAPWEAVLGAQIVVPTLSGSVKLKVPPGTQQGRQLRVRGQGLPRSPAGTRGDLFAIVKIQVPAEVSQDEREAWEKLARVARFNPRENPDT